MVKAILILALAVVACRPSPMPPPLDGDPGIPNLYQVGPGLWRSGQPTTTAQWAYLKGLGVDHVVKMNFASEGSDDGAATAGMDVHVLSIQPEGDKDLDDLTNTLVQPSPDVLREAESIIAAGGEVLVHCTHGQDRTGLVIGLHRVNHERWPTTAAYDEMLQYGFHPQLHGLHEFWENFRGIL